MILWDFWEDDPNELIESTFFRIPGLTVPLYTIEEVVQYEG